MPQDNFRRIAVILGWMLALSLPVMAQETTMLEANLTGSCVADGEFDPNLDYFPDKVEVEFTEGFAIEYFNNYKLVTLLRPWSGAAETNAVQYVLVQCGTPAPDDYEDATVVEVPVETFATMSTTYLPYVEIYGLIDHLTGVDLTSTVSTPSIREKVAAGGLVAIAPNFELDREAVLELGPDMIMTYGFGFDTDGYLLLEEDGHTVVLNGEFADVSPLARAEWGKYLALFFNKEAEAEAAFDDVVADYAALTDLVANGEDRPTVFVNAPFDDTWFMAGGSSYIAQFISDAGADYLWAEDDAAMTLFLDFESVLERAVDADFWVNADQFWFTMDDLLAADERYSDFAAVRDGAVWSNNLALTETFGNDFFESGVAYPNWILADLIAIFHPELLPDHEFVYYQQLAK